MRQSGDSDPGGDEKFFGLSRQARGRVGRNPADQVVAFDGAEGVVAHPAAYVLHADLPDAVR